MPLDRSGVLGLLEAVDDELTRKITLVAAYVMPFVTFQARICPVKVLCNKIET